MANKRIRVQYCYRCNLNPAYSSGCQDFNDWFDFADWLKQTTLNGPVLITTWDYIDSVWEDFPKGWIKAEAMRLARKAVKEEMVKQGIKVTRVEVSEITRAAKALLIGERRDEFLRQAGENYKANPTTSYIKEN